MKKVQLTGIAILILCCWNQGKADWAPSDVGLTNAQLRASPVPVSATIDTTGLATDSGQSTGNATLAGIKAGTDKIPTSPAQEHSTAAAPNSCRLSDGAAFISTLPVSIASMPSTPVTAAALPLPSGAVTSAKQDTGNTSSASIDTKTPTLGQAAMAASSPVVIASNQSTIPVSLASAPTTAVTAAALPLPSGASTSAKQPALGTAGTASADVLSVQGVALMTPLKVDGSGVTQPISHANLDVALSTRLKPADTLAGVTTVTTVSNVTQITNALPAGNALLGKTGIDQTTPGTTNKVSIGSDGTVALGAGAAKIGQFAIDQTTPGTTNLVSVGTNGTVGITSAAATAKGAQGANGVPVQELKDSGRTQLRFYFNAVASGTTGSETAITMTKSSGTAATANAASFVITSGKTMRISSVMFGSRGHLTATAQVTNCRIRVNTAGGVTTSSTPVIYDMATATPATALAWDRSQVTLSEGDEIAGNGTIQFGVTCAAVFTTNAPTWFGLITAYEY